MSAKQNSVSGGTSRLKVYTAVLFTGFTLGVAVGVLGALVWDTLGEMERTTRLSSLKILREHLRTRAERQGRYPANLAIIIEETGWDSDLDTDNLQYWAAGKPYDADSGDLTVFFERRPRRYGFVVGRFELRQDYHIFWLGRHVSEGASIP